MQHLVRRGAILACGGALALAAGPASPAVAQGPTTAKERYLERVNLERMNKHLEAFQHIADLNGGNRAAGTPGYLASVRYVVGQLRSAKYRPTVQAFDFPFFQQTGPTVFERVSPSPRVYDPSEFATQEFSGSGDFTGQVQPVDVVVPFAPTPNTSSSGCEAADFAGFVPGRVALMQRGTCSFGQKAANAAAAGASAAIIFNEGQPGRTGVISGTLGGPTPIPVVDTSYDVGAELVELARAGATTVRIKAETFSETRKAYNVIADSTLGNPDKNKTIVVGAHLDSVIEGPGVNDNGSGSAMILELARQLHRIGKAPKNKVRFAFWGAEESGLLGSEYYVSRLTPYKLGLIKMNLNFDMVASPNGVLGVYDGDGSDTPLAGPAGSDDIEQAFLRAFDDQGRITVPSEFSGRSDYGPFIAEGIPAGGLFTGAEQLKTPEQEAVYGGTAGEQLDQCYHQACDTLANTQGALSQDLLDANSNSAAAVLYDYSQASTLFGAGATARKGARSASFQQLNGSTLTGKSFHPAS